MVIIMRTKYKVSDKFKIKINFYDRFKYYLLLIYIVVSKSIKSCVGIFNFVKKERLFNIL